MIKKTLEFIVVVFLVTGLFVKFCWAETKNHVFDVYLFGLKAGELRYAINEQQDAYSAAGILESTGLASAIARYKFEVTTTGQIQNGKYSPLRYTENADTGRRKEEKTLIYRKNTIQVQSRKLPKPYWVDPTKQMGTVDPMTAIILILSDQTSETICTQKIPLFDGARRVELNLSNPTRLSNKQVQCDGLYVRKAGFSKNEMKDGSIFPFTVFYSDINDTYRVKSLDITTNRGRASFVRR